MGKSDKNKVSPLRNESRILLAGNGISDAQKISWKNILSFVQDKLVESKQIEAENKIEAFENLSPTIFLESLCKRISDSKEIQKLVKEYIADKSNFVHKLWNLYNVILTTNFDNNLVINKVKLLENESDPKEKELTYKDKFLYRRLDFTYDKHQKTIFFIHGYFKQPSTICLSFEQYTKNLKRIEDFVIQDYSEKNFEKKKNRKSVSWLEYFFKDNTTIDILGLSLCNDEIDLWWILNYRKTILNRLKNNQINYYDLKDDCFADEKTKSVHSAKLKSLESFGINIVYVEKASDYNSDFYSLCLKQIRENFKEKQEKNK